jgi:S1-C subfamily serine protease
MMSKTGTKTRSFETVVSDVRSAVFAVTRHRPAAPELDQPHAFQGWALGSGFFISSRIFVTCAHVINSPANPHRDGDDYHLVNISPSGAVQVHQLPKATVGKTVHLFPDADLAILEINDGQERDFLPIDHGELRVGMEIAVAGYPLPTLNAVNGNLTYDGLIFRVAKDVVNATYRATFGSDAGGPYTDMPVIEVNFLFVPGNSGGPIFSADKGRVLGFVHGYRLQKIKEQVETVSLIQNFPASENNKYILHQNALYSIGFRMERVKAYIEKFGISF